MAGNVLEINQSPFYRGTQYYFLFLTEKEINLLSGTKPLSPDPT
jgi:hypothetical protein